MFNIAERRRLWYTISALVIIPGIIAMIYSTITYGSPVRLSIDFTGGSLYEVKFEDTATEEGIREVYTDLGQDDPVIQRLGEVADNTWQIRASTLSADEQAAIGEALNENVAPVDEDQSQFTNVDPSIGREVTIAAVLAVVAAAVVILGFIWIAFRRVPHAVRYGASAIAAMIHDVLVTMGMMSIIGIVFGWEVDALFLTAVLTVVAFSIQDTIVIFDRIRENLPKYRNETFERVVNRSVLETIHRSLATQLNAVFIMIAILLFGGATIKQFIAILLIGLMSGTYSSIFNAVPILVSWHKGELPFIKADAEA
jgi:preprotein translocase SecF subunit